MKHISFYVKDTLYKNNSKSFFSEKIIKEQFALSRKSFIANILKLIKDSQLDYLSLFLERKKENNSSQKICINSIKNILISLKKNLISVKKEKIEELTNIKTEKNNKKISFISYKKSNKLQKELVLLKQMNFQYENENKKIENLTNLKNKHLYLIKSYECFLEIFNEHFFNSQKNMNILNNIYFEKLSKLHKKLFNEGKKIKKEEKKMEQIKKEINNLKNIIEAKEKMICQKDIIKEDISEYNITTENDSINNRIVNQKKVYFKYNKEDKNMNQTIILNNNANYKKSKNSSLFKEYSKLIENNINKSFFKRRKKHIYSCPEIRTIQNFKNNHSSIFLKNNIRNHFINDKKTISDIESSTISSLNGKTFESKIILNMSY